MLKNIYRWKEYIFKKSIIFIKNIYIKDKYILKKIYI